MVKCSEIFQSNSFNSYSEFMLALALGRECLRLGTSLDMSDMRPSRRDIVTDDLSHYYSYLVEQKGIYLGIEYTRKKAYPSKIPMFLNTDCISEMEDILFKDCGNYLEWSFSYVHEYYLPYEKISPFLMSDHWSSTILHLVAYHIIDCLSKGNIKKLKVIIDDPQKIKSTYVYIHLISCIKSMKWLSNFVELDIDFTGYAVDVDYSIFFNNGVASKHNRELSMTEKKEILNQEGIIEGGIYLVWQRGHMNESNTQGIIKDCLLVRLDSINEYDISATTVTVGKTKEEILDDYYSMPDYRRFYFADMVKFENTTYQKNISLWSLGINDYIYVTDTEFITKIDKNAEPVHKKITIQGKSGVVEMSEIDAIYWILRQYDIEFDKELYKSMYSPDEILLWDRYYD